LQNIHGIILLVRFWLFVHYIVGMVFTNIYFYIKHVTFSDFVFNYSPYIVWRLMLSVYIIMVWHLLPSCTCMLCLNTSTVQQYNLLWSDIIVCSHSVIFMWLAKTLSATHSLHKLVIACSYLPPPPPLCLCVYNTQCIYCALHTRRSRG